MKEQLWFYIGNLNFKQLDWVLGNYDRKIADYINQFAVEFNNSNPDRKIVIHEGPMHVQANGNKYVVVHEPNDIEFEKESDETVLFGHIHGRAFAKRDGFDLATDYSRYTPLSLSDVEWYRNAMKYWDDNVYSDRCNTRDADSPNAT